MRLFRPYEQGANTSAEHEAGAPEPGQGTPAPAERTGRGATRADLARPRPADESLPVDETQPVDEDRHAPAPKPRGRSRRPVEEPETPPPPVGTTRQPRKKSTRTPTRAEAEAARMARLHPTLSPKEQKKAQREMEREARMRSLDAVESAPDRALLRDHIDAHFSPTELTMPLMLVMIMCMVIFSGNFTVQAWLSYLLVILFGIFIIFFVVTWRGFRRLAAERGIETGRRGLRMYMVNRMMAMRRMRRPEPRVQRGESY